MEVIYTTAPVITIDDVCGKPEGTFAQYMLAKNAILKAAQLEPPSLVTKIELTNEEVVALFEYVPSLREFYRQSLL